MRVLYFHQHFTTPSGAAGTRSYEFAKRLIDRGHQVTLVCGSYGMGTTGLGAPFVRGRREGLVDGIRVIEFALPYSNKTHFLRRVVAFLRFATRSASLAIREDYDMAFASSTPLTAAIPGIVAKLTRRKRFVFEVRDLWPDLPRAMGAIRNPLALYAMHILEGLAYRFADGCIGLAPGIVDAIKTRAPQGRKVAFISNGSQPIVSIAVPAQIDGISERHFVAVFAGAHGMANGLDAVLDAALVLKERADDSIRLLFVGDGMLKADLITRAREQGLTACIFHDPVSRQKLESIYARANVGLMVLADVPEFAQGTSPNKLFDYLAHGLPVIANYPGWVADMIEEWRCGFVVRSKQPEELADTLAWMRDNPQVLGSMGLQGRRLLAERFDYGTLADRFVDFLEMA